MNTRTVTWLACSAWVFSVAMVALGVLLNVLNDSGPKPDFDFQPVEALVAVTFPTVGALVAARRPQNLIGWIFCVMGLSQATSVFALQYGVYTLFTNPGALPLGTGVYWLEGWAWAPGYALFAFLFLLFPNGRLLSRRWRWVAWLTAGGLALWVLPTAIFTWQLSELQAMALMEDSDPSGEGANLVLALGLAGFLLMTVGALFAVCSLILRLRRARGVERQQLKWFTYAAALGVFFLAISAFGSAAGVLDENSFAGTAIDALNTVSAPCIPIAAGIAILRYRLYDIDVVINRTLVYGALTTLMALVYFGSVVTLQYVFRALTGQQSQLAIIASTLLIAALFGPLRRRLQDLIDRRFYRKKYVAAKTLEAFSARLRKETDLEALSEELLTVVRDTMHPAHAWLWLRPPPGRKTEKREKRT